VRSHKNTSVAIALDCGLSIVPLLPKANTSGGDNPLKLVCNPQYSLVLIVVLNPVNHIHQQQLSHRLPFAGAIADSLAMSAPHHSGSW
jgi:hypothetical protein